MKRVRRLTVFLSVLFCIAVWVAAPIAASEKRDKTIDILFTSDVHSHLDSFEKTISDGVVESVGGMSGIATLVQEKREENPNILLVDGGDFSMGTLFQTVYTDQAAELGIFGTIGYDATTLGNHEFDYRSKGLADMLTTAAKNGEARPEILVCNVDWEAMEEDMTPGQKQLSQAFHDYGIRPYTVVEKGDVKIALIGVFGKDSLACAPTCELEFKDPVTSVKQTVEQIKDSEDVDMIVCLSHSGVNSNPKKSEDEQLAKAVPELDVIVSGHAHMQLKEPIVYQDTYIVSCGEYGEKLGELSLKEKDGGRWELVNYELIPVDKSVSISVAVQDKIDAYKQHVNEDYLSQFGYQADQILAYNPHEFSTVQDITNEHTEHNLGNIIADSYMYAAGQADSQDDTLVSLTVAPSGTIRGTYARGDVEVEHVFESFSLGIGADGVVGYPLVSAYLTGRELKTIAEIDASVSDYMNSARVYCSGMNFTFNPGRIILNKVKEVSLVDAEGRQQEIEDDRLYRIVSDMYTGQMLGEVSESSYGILSVIPKFADGTPIENLEDAILYRSGREIKAWTAIAEYMQSFPENENGVPEIPDMYAQAEGRKIVETDGGITARFSHLNKYAIIIIFVPVLLLAVFTIILVLFVRHFKKELKKK